VLGSDVPVVILINRYSASASEIVAGCLQDHQRATLIGEQSWGKGTVQNIIPVRPEISAMKLTTASYWRPSGKPIDRGTGDAEDGIWGVRPDGDLVVSLEEEEVLKNIQKRNIRDIATLIPTDKRDQLVPILLKRTKASSEPIESSDDDSAKPTEDVDDGSNLLEWTDEVLQRAIDFLEPASDRIAA